MLREMSSFDADSSIPQLFFSVCFRYTSISLWRPSLPPASTAPVRTMSMKWNSFYSAHHGASAAVWGGGLTRSPTANSISVIPNA